MLPGSRRRGITVAKSKYILLYTSGLGFFQSLRSARCYLGCLGYLCMLVTSTSETSYETLCWLQNDFEIALDQLLARRLLCRAMCRARRLRAETRSIKRCGASSSPHVCAHAFIDAAGQIASHQGEQAVVRVASMNALAHTHAGHGARVHAARAAASAAGYSTSRWK